MSKETMVPMYRLELVRENTIPFTKVDSVEAAAEVFHGMLDRAHVEKMAVIHCDSNDNMIGCEIVAVGSLEKVGADMSDVFKGALKNNAASIWFAHNHPVGNKGGIVKASIPDFLYTDKLISASELIGVRLNDHLVVAPGMHYSIKANFRQLATEAQRFLQEEAIMRGRLPFAANGETTVEDQLPWDRGINKGWDEVPNMCDCPNCEKRNRNRK